MDLQSLTIMGALKSRMGWLSQNQRVISENVANSDTPNYMAQRLEAQSFSKLVNYLSVQSSGKVEGPDGVSRPISMSRGRDLAPTYEDKDAPISPTGNSVELEEEMLRLADNQLEYGLITEIYKKNKGLLTAAMGRRGI